MNEIRRPALEGKVLQPRQERFPVRFTFGPDGPTVICLTCGTRAHAPEDAQQWLRGHIAQEHS